MKDSEFKQLEHRTPAYHIAVIGREAARGYKPDLTVKNRRGQIVFIVESEQKTDRKAFLGDLVKAEKFAEGKRWHPVLIIVMQPLPNTTVPQIARHLAPYAAWLRRLKGGSLHLSEILVISDDNYQHSVQANEELGSPQFRARAIRISDA
ncbi:MAG: hypothetical protein HY360_01500 [Verrucomicrobia bacterium]|nr:hypothetical protein [Verrucomicrobiota bacterium]